MAKIGLPKGSGKRLKVREKSVKSQGILKWILSGNPVSSQANLKYIFVSPYLILFYLYGSVGQNFFFKLLKFDTHLT